MDVFTHLSHSNCDKNYYGEDYYNSEAGKFSTIIEKLFRFNHIKNAKFLNNNFQGRQVLEVGCGRGYILKELKKLGADVYCLESADAADWILNNHEIKVYAFNEEDEIEWPFSPDFFHLIIFWHVLEHFPDPVESLKRAAPASVLGEPFVSVFPMYQVSRHVLICRLGFILMSPVTFVISAEKVL